MASNPLCSYTILVVDDEPTNTKLLSKLLARAGYESVVATNDPREVLALTERHRPGLVLLDLNMPHIDGFGVLAQLREQLGDNCPPIVILTAQSDRPSRLQALQGGARDFLTKPFDHAELLVRIENMLALRRAEEERLHFFSHYDNLTSLPNRDYSIRLLEDNLAHRHDQTIAVLLLALQRFDRVNQSLGHEAGDRFLCSFKDRILNLIPSRQTIVGRIDGARFLIVLQDMDTSPRGGLADWLQQLLSHLHAPLQLDEVEFRPTPHIGVAIFPKDGDNARDLLTSADAALARARSQTDIPYAFSDAATEAQVREQLQLEAELHRAIERQELFLVYQPQVALASGRILGAEALLRWQHPRQGVVPPDQFIPLLEETGLINLVGEWLIDQACAQTHDWINRHPSLESFRIAINLSPRQFQGGTLHDQIVSALARYSLSPDRLELEVTESLLIEDLPGTHQLLKQLEAVGLRIALDDFGTGYSALTYLQAFPFHAMKVDRSFVQTIGETSKAEALLKAIVQLGKSLDLEVVAEGIENRAQFDFLNQHGCDIGQGFGLARPQSAAQMDALLARGAIVPPAH